MSAELIKKQARAAAETAAGSFDLEREVYLNRRLAESEVEDEFGLKVGFLRARRLRGGQRDRPGARLRHEMASRTTA